MRHQVSAAHPLENPDMQRFLCNWERARADRMGKRRRGAVEPIDTI